MRASVWWRRWRRWRRLRHWFGAVGGAAQGGVALHGMSKIENVTAVKVLTAALNGFEKKFLLSRALGSGPLNLAIDAPQESQENRHGHLSTRSALSKPQGLHYQRVYNNHHASHHPVQRSGCEPMSGTRMAIKTPNNTAVAILRAFEAPSACACVDRHGEKRAAHKTAVSERERGI